MRLKILENDCIVTCEISSLDDLKRKVEELKKDFIKFNKVDFRRKNDNYYERYCNELDNLVKEYTDGDLLHCKTCTNEDHEGMFCRCESRNIRIAKDKRLKRECQR